MAGIFRSKVIVFVLVYLACNTKEKSASTNEPCSISTLNYYGVSFVGTEEHVPHTHIRHLPHLTQIVYPLVIQHSNGKNAAFFNE